MGGNTESSYVSEYNKIEFVTNESKPISMFFDRAVISSAKRHQQTKF